MLPAQLAKGDTRIKSGYDEDERGRKGSGRKKGVKGKGQSKLLGKAN
jgi:hypothetical protein